jgi:SulP family sulfate permease
MMRAPAAWRTEWRAIGHELRRRFAAVTLDYQAPLAVVRAVRGPHRRADLWGGLAVSVMAVPQVLAYAIIAGVPPVMGLYSLIVVTWLAGLWCHCAHLSCGPSNASALMLGAVLLSVSVPGQLPTQVALIALVMGLFQLVGAFLSLGNLAKYISRTVVVGYSTAIGVLIFLNQIANFVGTKTESSQGLFAKIWSGLATLPEAHLPSVWVGLVSLLTILLVGRWLPRIPAGFAGVVMGGVVAALLPVVDPEFQVRLVADVQRIPGGLPQFVAPAINLNTIYELVGPAIALGLLASIEVSTVAKNMAMRTGQPLRANQDILGLGLGNLGGAFFGAMPGSVSFTRSEFSFRNGVQTRLGLVACAVAGLGIVLVGRGALEKIPIPSLAALIMWLSIKLLHGQQIRVALTSTYSDALVWLVTFFAAIFLRLDSAIYLGMLVSMGLFLQKASTPRLMEFQFDEQGRFRPVTPQVKETLPEVSIIHVEGELFFAAAETIQEDIWRTIERDRTKVVVLRLRNAQNLDATGVMVLQQLIRDLRTLGIQLLISGTSPEIDRVVERSGLVRVLGKENYFPSAGNFLDATRRAVLRANEITGTSRPQIRLFYDQDQEANRNPANRAPA